MHYKVVSLVVHSFVQPLVSLVLSWVASVVCGEFVTELFFSASKERPCGSGILAALAVGLGNPLSEATWESGEPGSEQ